jgi:hypothetical protein
MTFHDKAYVAAIGMVMGFPVGFSLCMALQWVSGCR